MPLPSKPVRRSLLALALLACGGPALAAGDSALGGAELYTLDAAHSSLEFVVEFMGLSKVRGRFERVDGAILFDPAHPEGSSVTVIVPVDGLDTGNDARDRHLASPDWFDQEAHPRITFQSRRIERIGDRDFSVHGRLTIHGVTKEVAIPMTLLHGDRTDAWGNRRIGFEGSLRIDRRDYGVVGTSFFNEAFDVSRMGVSDEVEIDLTISGRIFNMEKIAFGAAEGRRSVGEVLLPIVESQGVDAALERYRSLRAEAPEAYDFGPRQLNTLGYKLLQRGEAGAAVAVFELAAAEHPGVPAILDSLGTAYAEAGRKEDAIRTLREALGEDPWMASAVETLRRLEGHTGVLTLGAPGEAPGAD